MLTDFTASELYGKSVLLAYEPATDADKAIYDSYDSIFDVPAYAVYMKPVIYVDGEAVAEGDEYLETTLGTKQTFTIGLSSALGNHDVTNDVTTGSMYAVTLDMQSITSSELQGIYDDASALSDSVTEANVYSADYLGKLLSLAGRLYFAQVDMADIMTAEAYGVTAVRSLSEGITGYEVKTETLYGQISGLSEGSLYIDVDTDSHSVISLTGDEDASREYMLSTGMMGSLCESLVWEEITGCDSVSAVSLISQAREEEIDILLISDKTLSTDIEKLEVDDETKKKVTEAVNKGMVVTIPAQTITSGDWSGVGYIVTDPDTGAGSYMISGGLCGGSVDYPATYTFLLASIYTCGMMAGLLGSVESIVYLLVFGGPIASVIAVGILALICYTIIQMVDEYYTWTNQYLDYLYNDDVDAAFDMMYSVSEDLSAYAKITAVFGGATLAGRGLIRKFSDPFSKKLEQIAKLKSLTQESFWKKVKVIGRSRLYTNDEKIKLIKKLYGKLDDIADVCIIDDAKYISGFTKEGKANVVWPEKMGFDAKTVTSISRENSIPEVWDRVGSMNGSNFSALKEDGGIYTYSERSIHMCDLCK